MLHNYNPLMDYIRQVEEKMLEVESQCMYNIANNTALLTLSTAKLLQEASYCKIINF